jgi:hypothetical protein
MQKWPGQWEYYAVTTRACGPQESPYFIDPGIGAIRRVFVDGPPEDGLGRRDEERGPGERAL